MLSIKKLKTRRSSSTIPFGYVLDTEDSGLLQPIEHELEALETILPMIKSKSLSLREGALWLSHKTGRSISHEGLRKISQATDDRHNQ